MPQPHRFHDPRDGSVVLSGTVHADMVTGFRHYVKDGDTVTQCGLALSQLNEPPDIRRQPNTACADCHQKVMAYAISVHERPPRPGEVEGKLQGSV